MLLTGNADPEDGLAIDVGRQQRTAGGDGEGIQPLPGILFAATIGATDQRVGGGTEAQHFTADSIEDDGFGALGAAIDAEE
ncbi:hypothetical protein D3C87_1748610 [compost metagenome]